MKINLTFTKHHTKIVKGIAMLLMLFDHLFWMESGKYNALIKIPMYHDIPWLIGSLGNICVSMFLFLSGYGMYITAQNQGRYTFKDAFIRIKNMWFQYAFITTLIIILDFLFGKITFDIKKIILNLLALDFSYNKYAWFMITYIIIILVFPLMNYLMAHSPWMLDCLIVIGIKGAITFLNSVINFYISVPEIAYKTLMEPFMFLPVFLIGYIIAKYDIFTKVSEKIFSGKLSKLKYLLLILATLSFMVLVPHTIFDNITAPLLCFGFAYLIYATKIQLLIEFIGNQSMNMWLIHYPIMITLLNKLVYAPRYWLLILIWIILIMIPISFGIDKFMKLIKGN